MSNVDSSLVYSTDMFYSVFAKDPMNPKEGRRYRHMVLEKGGSQPGDEDAGGLPRPQAEQ